MILATVYSHDSFGNRRTAAVTGWNGQAIETRTSTTTWDASGRYRNKVTNAEGEVVEEVMSRDGFGRPTTVRNVHGADQDFAYGAFGRAYFSRDGSGAFTHTTYRTCSFSALTCPASAVYEVETVRGGQPTAYVYLDVLEREVRRSVIGFDGTPHHVDREYDALGRLRRESEPFSSWAQYWTEYSYDILGRVTKVIHPDNSQSSVSYNGLIRTETNGLNQQRTEERNVAGELVKVTDHNLGYVEYGYDAQGNLKSALQGGPGVTTVLTSLNADLRGRKTSMTAPDHGTWTYVHNAFGELVSQTDANQQITTAAFDRAGRLIRRDHYGAGESPASVEPLDRSEWIWIQGKMVLEDTYRRLSTSQMEPLPRLARNFVYDVLGRVEEVHTTIQGTNYVERTTYDQFGRVFQSFDASGVDRGAEHIYNAQGYLSRVIEAQFSATTTQVHHEVLAMNARGQVTSQRKAGTTETRQYDPVTGMPSLFQVRNAAQQSLDTQTFQFDTLGNLTARTQGSHSETLSYDNLNRLTGVNTAGSAPNLSVAYNALGNITNKSNVGSYSYGAGSAGPHAVTSAGGVSYAYDANGNMISGNGRSITWMPFNKPAQIQQSNRSVSFEYGPQRERYQRTDSTSSGTTITRYVGSVEIITRPGSGGVEHAVVWRVDRGHVTETRHYDPVTGVPDLSGPRRVDQDA